MTLPSGTILLFDFDVVRADITVLLGIDVMRQCGLNLDFTWYIAWIHPGIWTALISSGTPFYNTYDMQYRLSFEQEEVEFNLLIEDDLFWRQRRSDS